jgi:hypothetical protein
MVARLQTNTIGAHIPEGAIAVPVGELDYPQKIANNGN